MTQKNSGCLWMLGGFVLCLALVIFVGVLAFGSHQMRTAVVDGAPQFEESVVVDAQRDKGADRHAKIALISLRGLISSAEPGVLGETMVDDLKIQLEQAATDENVKAVVLCVDSPGGEVTASDAIYNAVRKVREGGFGAAKPVVVSMGSLAASGGYYVACGGSWLIASETTLTGSIGVIMQTLNYQQLLGKVGLEPVTFKSGPFKDMLSGAREITPEEKAYVQKMVMDTYGKFVGIVARERQLDEAALRSGVADGRVLSGKDASAAKLINSLGEVEDAYAKAMELAKIKTATVIRYESPFKLGRVLRLLGQEESAKIEIDVTRALLPKLEAGRLYFLPAFYAP